MRTCAAVLAALTLSAATTPLVAQEERRRERSVFDVAEDPDRPRSDIGMPILTFVLPGLDQWLEGQHRAAAAYSGVALGGYMYAGNVAASNHLEEQRKKNKEEAEKNGDDDPTGGLDQKDLAERKYALGMLAAQGAGGLSTYHSFRTAVRTRQKHGQYEFLKAEDTPLDLLEAPFHFEYLARPTTLVPLLIIGALSAYQLSADLPEDSDYERTSFTQADALFTGAYSYNAGTHEEAVFRGWLMPVLHEYGMSPFFANATQAVAFALAHLNTVSQPLPQLLLGYHLGNVTQDNGWSLKEGVFIHAWWDVLAFATQYHYKRKAPEAEKSRIMPVLWLPPLQLAF